MLRPIHFFLGMIPLSATSHTNQVQTVPVRFNPQLIVDGSNQQQQHQNQTASHQIITMQSTGGIQQSTSNGSGTIITTNQQTITVPQQTHMLIPVAAKGTTVTTSPRPSILRKRDNEGYLLIFIYINLAAVCIMPALTRITTFFSSPLTKSAVKNLGPTLLQMSGPTILEKDINRDRLPSSHSPGGSSEGSTTVSATSSPGIDQQEEQEELNVAMKMQMRIPEMAFKAVEEIYNHPQVPQVVPVHFQQQNSTSSSSNGNEDASPRKKPKKQQVYVLFIIFIYFFPSFEIIVFLN